MDIPHDDLLEAFFREFHFALRNASLYPQSHPSFRRTVESFYASLERLKPHYRTIFFSILPTGILFNDTLLTREQSPFYGEIAAFLHTRTVESIELTTTLGSIELEQFIVLISRKNSDELKNLLSAYQSASITIKLLDFSGVLTKEGEETPSDDGVPGWEERLKRLFTEKKPDEFKAAAESLLKETAQNPDVDKALRMLETLFAEEKVRTIPFIKELIRVVRNTAENPSEELHQGTLTAFQRIIARHAPPEAVSRLIAALESFKKGAAAAMVKEIGDRVEEPRQESIAMATAKSLKLQGILLKNRDAVESLQQLALTQPTNRFASMMYAYTLKYFTQMNTAGTLRYLREATEGFTMHAIQRQYLAILYDLLRVPADTGDLPGAEKDVLENGLQRLLGDYLRQNELERAFSMLDTLRKIDPAIGSSLIIEPLVRYMDLNSETLFGDKIETLLPFKETVIAFMEEKLSPEKTVRLFERYLQEKNRQRKDALAAFIALVKQEQAIETAARLACTADMERLLELINLLSLVSRPACQGVLVGIYRNNTAEMIKLAVIKAMRRNAGLRSRKFLLAVLQEQQAPSLLRTEIINTLLAEQDSFINNKIVTFLLEQVSLSAIVFDKPVFRQTLSFIRETGLPESIFFLAELLKKQAFVFMFFRKSRQEILSVVAALKKQGRNA